MRKSFTAKDRLRIFTAHGGICGLSGVKIGPTDAWHIEHRVPVALGGSNDDENLYPALVEPHKDKTRDDVKRIAKAKRQSGVEGGQYARRMKNGPKLKSGTTKWPKGRKIENRGWEKKRD